MSCCQHLTKHNTSRTLIIRGLHNSRWTGGAVNLCIYRELNSTKLCTSFSACLIEQRFALILTALLPTSSQAERRSSTAQRNARAFCNEQTNFGGGKNTARSGDARDHEESEGSEVSANVNLQA